MTLLYGLSLSLSPYFAHFASVLCGGAIYILNAVWRICGYVLSIFIIFFFSRIRWHSREAPDYACGAVFAIAEAHTHTLSIKCVRLSFPITIVHMLGAQSTSQAQISRRWFRFAQMWSAVAGRRILLWLSGVCIWIWKPMLAWFAEREREKDYEQSHTKTCWFEKRRCKWSVKNCTNHT